MTLSWTPREANFTPCIITSNRIAKGNMNFLVLSLSSRDRGKGEGRVKCLSFPYTVRM